MCVVRRETLIKEQVQISCQTLSLILISAIHLFEIFAIAHNSLNTNVSIADKSVTYSRGLSLYLHH